MLIQIFSKNRKGHFYSVWSCWEIFLKRFNLEAWSQSRNTYPTIFTMSVVPSSGQPPAGKKPGVNPVHFRQSWAPTLPFIPIEQRDEMVPLFGTTDNWENFVKWPFSFSSFFHPCFSSHLKLKQVIYVAGFPCGPSFSISLSLLACLPEKLVRPTQGKNDSFSQQAAGLINSSRSLHTGPNLPLARCQYSQPGRHLRGTSATLYITFRIAA